MVIITSDKTRITSSVRPPHEARREAKKDTCGHPDERREDADVKRIGRAHDQQRKQVLARDIGAQRMGP